MNRKSIYRTGVSETVLKTPKRCEIWHVEDKDENHKMQNFDDSVQGGDRFCIIVSNNMGNRHAPVVEVVYTTTKQKHDLPTHFSVTSTPEPSTVLCEQIMTVAKTDLTSCYGMLTTRERLELDKCLKVSLGL